MVDFNYAIPKAAYDDSHKKIKKCLGHGTRNRRIIREVDHNGFTYRYHATKGWRKNKMEK